MYLSFEEDLKEFVDKLPTKQELLDFKSPTPFENVMEFHIDLLAKTVFGGKGGLSNDDVLTFSSDLSPNNLKLIIGINMHYYGSFKNKYLQVDYTNDTPTVKEINM